MKIRDIDFGPQPVFLAPMEDVTDPAFRLLCKEFGAEMVYSEFVSADALIRNVNRSLEKIRVQDEERPVAVQIYGRDVESMVEAARMVEEAAKPDVLDINFGCPVKKVAGKGAGAGMLKNIPLMLDITRAVVKAVKLPVTVKTRLGWDHENKVIVELAEQLQDCGIEALTIHGRTRSQMYTGEAWIFKEIRTYLDTGEHAQLSTEWKLDVLRRQIRKSVECSMQRTDCARKATELGGIIHVRRHLASSPLFKGIPDFKPTRIRMLRAETMDELFKILDEAAQKLRENA